MSYYEDPYSVMAAAFLHFKLYVCIICVCVKFDVKNSPEGTFTSWSPKPTDYLRVWL